ncbi:MAG: hypothetical protein H6835_06860 [Planctomycetes bacterium]|nr:hypothetical protein [Planctomycetota bacterium]
MRIDERRLAILCAAPAILLLAFQATWPWPFFSDDAFISLRFADRLLHGDGLTWTDGERVEGYSNLLFVLLTAGLGALGLELVDAARLIGAVSTLLALWLLALALRPKDLRTGALATIPPLLVASSQTVLGWTLGGLEGPLLLALLAWGIGGVVTEVYRQADPTRWQARVLLRLGAPFALACWTRPDAPLWALGCGGGLLLLGLRSDARAALRATVTFGAPALVAVLAQSVFRVVYYGDVVPNTAHVKAGFDPARLGDGVTYVTGALLAVPGLTTLAIVGAALIAWLARPRRVVWLLLLPLGAWLCYLVTIGGDHFPGRRLLHGALVPMALLAGLGGYAAARSLPATLVVTALGVAATTVDVWFARTDPQSLELRGEVWEWRGKALGEALERAFADRERADRPLLAVDAAGALPYYSRLPALDMLGLCDRTIATTPEPAWIATMRPEIPRPPGHLRGNGAYVMDRAPDLLMFSNPPGLPLPVFVSACEFEDDPRFLDGYRCVLLDLGEQPLTETLRETLRCSLWVRVEGAAGVRRGDDRVEVPAWLFGAFALPAPVQRRHQPASGDPQRDGAQMAAMQQVLAWYTAGAVTATVASGGGFALRLPAGATAEMTLSLPAGRWDVALEPPDSGEVRAIAGAGLTGEQLSVALPPGVAEGPVTLGLVGHAEGPWPQRLVLRRTAH